MVVICGVGAENQTPVLLKSNKYPKPMIHLSSPDFAVSRYFPLLPFIYLEVPLWLSLLNID